MSEHFVPVSPREVMVTTAGLQAMRRQWPCSGLPYDGYCVIFEYAQNGDLVDVKWHTDEGLDCSEPEGINGECLVALSKDAESFVEDWPAWRTRQRAPGNSRV